MDTNIEDHYSKEVSAYRLEKSGVNRETEIVEKIDSNVTFNNGGIFYKGQRFGTYDNRDRKIIIVRRNALNKQGLNPLLAFPKLPHNCTIIVEDHTNQHTFHTNKYGAVTKAIFFINQISNDFGKLNRRSSNEQRKGKMFNEEAGYLDSDIKEKDIAGHRCPDSVGGLSEFINIFPQNFISNHNIGTFKDFEDRLRKILKNNGDVKFEMNFKYDGSSLRPFKFSGKIYEEEGKEKEEEVEFSNEYSKLNSDLNALKQSNSKKSYSRNSFKVQYIAGNKIFYKRILFLLLLLFIFLGFMFYYWVNNYDKTVGSKIKASISIPDKEEIKFTSLRISEPLDTLTMSVTDLNFYKQIVENEKLISVIGFEFDFNSWNLNENTSEYLSEFIKDYNSLNNEYVIYVEGFTCSVGPEDYNIYLSEKRVDSIVKLLIENGVSQDFIKRSGKGSSRFNFSNGILKNNRRGNITLVLSS